MTATRTTTPSIPILTTYAVSGNKVQMSLSDHISSPTYFDFANLYRAYINCRKRKSRSFYHLQFAENLEKNLLTLEKQLRDRTYRPGRSIAFIVRKPKVREIFAADFRDRVVHHLSTIRGPVVKTKAPTTLCGVCNNSPTKSREIERVGGTTTRIIYKWILRASSLPLTNIFCII